LNCREGFGHDFVNQLIKWQDGYGAFSVSRSSFSDVITYIRNQRQHHRVRTFQEEYVAFLVRHEVEYDERYLWD